MCRNAEQMAVWEGLCVVVSVSGGRAAVQTPATDLMDEVSHTHLQCEHNHLHQTHMGQHNEPHSYNNVFLVTFFVFVHCFLLRCIHICFQCVLLSFH